MSLTVFISDLHLHPEEASIQNRFNQFIAWAKKSTPTIYILGDFFHAWPGDDAMSDWSLSIAQQLKELSELGLSLFYMHGNRDFLLGTTFAQLTGWTILPEPSIVQLGDEQVMLVHGDHYCTKDKSHQRFRALTRNRLFITLFLKLPLSYREKLVQTVRRVSQNNHKLKENMDVVDEEVISHMHAQQVTTVIHGHTHKPGCTRYHEKEKILQRYVLSDWDDSPQFLCYNSTEGFYFDLELID